MGICELITIVLVIAKIWGPLIIPWWQVFIPMYVAGVIYIGILLFALRMWLIVFKGWRI